MSYDIHVVRTPDRLDAAEKPITHEEIDAIITADPELEWSTDYVDMADDEGKATRYFMIAWLNDPCFWWYKDQVISSSPNEDQIMKLIRIAKRLNAIVVGDEGERYEIERSFFGKESLVTREMDS
jgi:hypothetical protein